MELNECYVPLSRRSSGAEPRNVIHSYLGSLEARRERLRPRPERFLITERCHHSLQARYTLYTEGVSYRTGPLTAGIGDSCVKNTG
jgi:hypothetical protein